MTLRPCILGSAVFVGTLALTGCATYQAQPLDSAAVNRALEAPPLSDVRAQAAALKHPLIRPLAIDGSDGYTPDEVAVMAVIESPELRALRDQRGVVEAQVIQAGILPNPSLGWTYDAPHGNADPTLVAAHSLGVSWDVQSLLTHHDTVRAAKASAKSLDLSIAWQEWQAAQDARLHAYRLLSLEARIPLARKVETLARQTVDVTRQAVQLGHKALPDLTTATEAWTTAQSARFDLEQQRVSEQAALDLALSEPAGEHLKVKAAPLPAEVDANLTMEAELAGLEDRRLDLVALKLGYESQEATLRAAVLGQFPKINLSVNRAQDTTPVKTLGYGVQVDIPIFDHNQGQIAIAKATRQQLFDEYVSRVAEARSQVGQILNNLAAIRIELRDTVAAMAQLEELNRNYETALREHNADLLAARDAESSLANRQAERAQLEQEQIEQAVALEIAVGRTRQP